VQRYVIPSFHIAVVVVHVENEVFD